MPATRRGDWGHGGFAVLSDAWYVFSYPQHLVQMAGEASAPSEIKSGNEILA